MKTKMMLMLTLAIIAISSTVYAAAPRIKFNEYSDTGIVAINEFNLADNGVTWTRTSDVHIAEVAEGYLTISNYQFFVAPGERSVLVNDPIEGNQGAFCVSDFIIMDAQEVANGQQVINFTFRSSDAEDFATLLAEAREYVTGTTMEIDGTQNVSVELQSNPVLVNFEQHDVDAVPEPSTFALLGLGLGGLAFLRRRK